MKVYARAKSKAALNKLLRENNLVPVKEYSLLRHGVKFTLGLDVPDGSEVAIYKKSRTGSRMPTHSEHTITIQTK